jgi:pyruvate/2-oxoglutarate dehydrogenase complex dihydrolipoamide dehydrogenase (E3) component
MAGDTYDVIVIGAGPTGENVADRAVRGGLTAVIVESELVGGECSYWACMPSKALLRSTQVVAEAGSVGGVTGARLDPPGVLARRDKFTHGWKDDSQVDWLTGAKIDLVRGHGRITGQRVVEVGDISLRARQAVVVATGTRAVVPGVLAGVHPWTSREATSAHAVPGSLAIVGGGVVGCEMAAAWSALGARVTLLSRGGLLDRLPGFAGDLVAEGLRKAGVDVRTGVGVTGASRSGTGGGDESGSHAQGTVTLTLDDGTVVRADEVLAAVGRAPRTEDLGLAAVGLAPGSWLDVDDTMRVHGGNGGGGSGGSGGSGNGSGNGSGGGSGGNGSGEGTGAGGWLYAAGDVNHLALLTHMGKYQARICGDAIAARAAGREPSVRDLASKTIVPQVIFTIPEVAAVGLTREQATSAGYRIRVVEYEIGNVAGAALHADGYTGHAQMVVDEDRQVIVGMTMTGPGVGEMIHAATIAVAAEVPLSRLWHAVPSYPTISEVWLRLLETYGL